MPNYTQADARPFEKHRLAVDDFEVDWTNRLASGEALSGNPTIIVVTLDSGSVTSATSEFGITNETTSGNKSQWRMGAASTGNQDEEDTYYLRVSQATDQGRTLISVHRLLVDEDADTTAP